MWLQKRDLLICKTIIEKVADKNPKCNLGTTPIHLAAQNGHTLVFRLISQKHK